MKRDTQQHPNLNSPANEVWNQCLSVIQTKVTSLSFKTWFQPMVPLKLIDQELTVQVPNQFFYDWIDQHYNSLIRDVITSVLGPEAKLFYAVSAEEPEEEAQRSLPFSPNPQRMHSGGAPFSNYNGFSPPSISSRQSEFSIAHSNLNSKYTFENFIKGDSNQLARAAAMAVANNPGGTSFNPLVIYGGTGLGKTHLMHALGNQSLKLGSVKKGIYVSSEKFTIEFVESIQSDKVNEFSHFYRGMDLLILDDIQFFAGKEKTQDNFFHTFNTLYQLGKQIVLSSDVPPKELKGLDERLISRFQSGLTADIQPPDFETRLAILQKKSTDSGVELPQDVIDFIATNVTSNVRELEGCLISLIAHSSLDNREINLDLAKDVLRVVVSDKRSPVTIDLIQKTVCEFFDIPEDLLRAKTRKQEVVTARQVAMYLAKELTHSSLKTVGLHFGGRDHSTVIHSIQSVDERAKTDQSFKQNIELLRRRLSINGR
ncbi:MAG: chromosomal replication initiator protein DnaA [bacterium]